ncbi:MAG TPA: XrtA/PEP-CTERM system histidine kinase PrsK [Stellaceae bacterium]|nr:XrtA/PEP-CTERM system histidine kinase PrsK [Stellaceae bacterium]
MLFAVAAGAYGLLLLLILLSPRADITRVLLAGACAMTAAAAAGMVVGWGGLHPSGAALTLAFTGSWCAFALHLLHKQMAGEAWAFWAIVAGGIAIGAAVLGFGLTPMSAAAAADGRSLRLVGELAARLALAVYGVLLVENLYRNADPDGRWHINTLCVGLGGMFAYSVLLYADALLFRRVSPLLWSGQAIAAVMAVPLLAVAAARNRQWAIDIHVSRAAVFHTATLIGSGIFLLALAATGELFRGLAAGWGELAEMTLLIAGIAAIAVVLTSGSARSYIRRLLADNFYTHRYDYRREWLKSIETLAVVPGLAGIQARVIRAVADVADSPAGVLFVRDLGGSRFQWAGSWNHPAVSEPQAADDAFAALFRDGEWVIELTQASVRPAWLAAIPGAWLAVPLTQKAELIGFVVLVRPRAPLRLDRETFDLLRIVARQSAIHVAEQRTAQALSEVQQLSDYSRRFAFVVHDMKNVASQLGMIAHNARSHRDDPEFQQDVFVTVASAFERMSNLLARLRPNLPPVTDGLIVPADLIRDEVASLCRQHSRAIEVETDGGAAAVAMDDAAFRSVIRHLCENALEASRERVAVRLRHDPLRLEVDIADDGPGMNAEFIRDRLFRPLGSGKRGGFGIGAYQARELVRAAGGDLLVISRPDCGTTMRIILPAIGKRASAEPEPTTRAAE